MIACHMPVVHLPEMVVVIAWQMVYWTTFVMCWVGYPLLQSYSTAGDFTFLERMRTSLRENAWFYAAAAAPVIILFFVLLFTLHLRNPVPVLMSLANCWGLSLLIVLLSYGLVEIPRRLWRTANYEMELKRCRFEVVSVRAKLISAREDLAKTLRTVKRYEEKVERSDPFWPFVATIIAKCPPEYKQVDHGEGSAELLYDKLVSLHYNLMAQEHNLRIYHDKFTRLVKRAFEVEDMLRSQYGEHRVRWTLAPHREWRLFAWLEWVWFIKLQPVVLRVIAIALALFSLIVIWCECVFFFDKPVLSLFALSIRPIAIRTNDLLLLLVLSAPLIYMMLCSYWALFQLKLLSYYRLIPHQQTDSNSIMFSAAMLCRLAPPLALNFIHMLKFSGSSFQVVMASMERMPFLGGRSFNSYAPIALVLLCVASFFNLGTKLMRCLRIKRFAYGDESEGDERQIEEGKTVLERERNLWISGTRMAVGEDERHDVERPRDPRNPFGSDSAQLASTAATSAKHMSAPFTTEAIRGLFGKMFSADSKQKVKAKTRLSPPQSSIS
jgi:hypothetical protein